MSYDKITDDDPQEYAFGDSPQSYDEPGSEEEALYFARSALASLLAGKPFKAQRTLDHFIKLRENWEEANQK